MRQQLNASGIAHEIDPGDLSDSYADAASAGNDSGKPAFDIRAFWALLYRHRMMMGAIIGACLIVGVASILFMPRIYEARTSVQIDQQTSKVLGTEDIEPVVSGTDADRFLQTQVDILNSRAMAKRVADSLALARSPAFAEAMGIKSLEKLGRDEQTELLLETLQKNLAIDLKRNSRVVGIFFRSRDPELAAKIANKYASEYIDSNIQRKFSTSDYSREFLRTQLGLAKTRLEASERELIQYARQSRLIDASAGAVGQTQLDGPRSLVTANLVQLNQAFAEAQAVRLQAQQRWEEARKVSSLTLPEALTNEAVQRLMQRRAELSADVSQMRQHMRADHPTVLLATTQLSELDNQTRAVADSILQSIRNQYNVALRQEEAIKAQVDSFKTATLSEQDLGVRYNILKREVDTNRQLYESLLQRFKELSAESGITKNNISIVDAADAPSKPSSPQRKVNMGLSLIAGLAFALLYAFGREKLDDAIRDPRDVESKLHIPLLGVVPVANGQSVKEASDASNSSVSEAYHSIRTAVQLSSPHGLPKSILITSSSQGEGKSTTAAILARKFAQLGKKTLIIDADLRRPSIHTHFGLTIDRVGLSNLLSRMNAVEDAILPSDTENLSVIVSGQLPPDPANLLASGTLPALLHELEKQFDLIIVDGPPVMALADAVQMTSSTDATIFVVEAQAAHYGRARAAVARLTRGRGNLIGCIITKYDIRKSGIAGDYDYYDYSYGKAA